MTSEAKIQFVMHCFNIFQFQIVIPWMTIAASSKYLLIKEPELDGEKNDIGIVVVSGSNFQSNSESVDRLNNRIHDAHRSDFVPTLPVELAATAVCLITVDDGAWASGILLNMDGLILTNAHLLEPWRFGKTTVTCERDRDLSESHIVNEHSGTSYQEGVERDDCVILHKKPANLEYFPSDNNVGFNDSPQSKGYRRIHVRLGQQYPWIWSYARVVYVSKGPLDVALLQLEHIPNQLTPIKVESTGPSPGSRVFVIGHGLFGPRSGKCFSAIFK